MKLSFEFSSIDEPPLPQFSMKSVPCFNMIVVVLCSAMSTTLFGQNISATINKIDHPTYAGIASGFELSDLKVDGQTIYNGSGYLFCADFEGTTLERPLEGKCVDHRGHHPHVIA